MFDMGLMGEAGPEAIMPLHRGPGGSLGVRAEVPLPQFPALGNNDVVQVLKDLKNENKQLRSDINRLLTAGNSNTRETANRVGAGNAESSKQREQQTRELRAQTSAQRTQRKGAIG
jgi:hypothetical protein